MKNGTPNRQRIGELDFLRGIALIFMVYFHTIYDMNEFFNYPIIYDEGINFWIGRISALLFMLVSGASCTLSKSNIKRGSKTLGVALVITLVTMIYNPGYAIVFGILHFLGISMILYPLFSEFSPSVLFVIGSVVLVLGKILLQIRVSVSYLFPFGLMGQDFVSSDYYPLLPWFGVFLFGAALGKLLYADGKGKTSVRLGQNFVSVIGKKTFIIYLLHQPVIMVVLIGVDYFR